MDAEGRDAQGRFLPGVSGNPRGRGPGRTPEEVNSLALVEVLRSRLTEEVEARMDLAALLRVRRQEKTERERIRAPLPKA